MKHLLFGVQYLLRHHLLGRPPPLICGLVLTNRCNLSCRHCDLQGRGDQTLSFDEVRAAIDAYYGRGGRCLYLEGGEPLLWRDGSHRVEHIIDYAHGLGFFTVIIYTNGTIPVPMAADTVFVSVDGLQETHDALRGPSFDRIVRNIRESSHPSLYINFTINSRNQGEIEEFCAFTEEVERIRGTFFYFHTPYYGHDELYLERSRREAILRDLLRLKKRYRILNSRAGLRSAIRNDWRRPLGICSVYEQGATYECCRFQGHPELCRECGYLSYAEIDQTLKLKPTAILNALKYF